MKITLFLFALCLAVSLVTAVRSRNASGDRRQILINRPTIDEFGPRFKRAPWPLTRAGGVKGGVKGRPTVEPPAPSPLEMSLRKGEYICEGKVCKLVPGEIPKGCHGVCQYPIW